MGEFEKIDYTGLEANGFALFNKALFCQTPYDLTLIDEKLIQLNGNSLIQQLLNVRALHPDGYKCHLFLISTWNNVEFIFEPIESTHMNSEPISLERSIED